MKKFLYIFSILLTISLFFVPLHNNVFAVDGNPDNLYSIYEDDKLIYERSDIEEGDFIITSDFDKYEIYKIDHIKKTALARFIGNIKKPDIKKNKNRELSINNEGKKIGLYLTHNDESYVLSDGYDSIYGKGGIHDVAKALKNSLENMGIEIILDETLHIPHNSTAYTRSKTTAQNLLKNKSNAIFDIHRDATSRSFYYGKIGNKEISKVRIVVGQNNVNFSQNLEFATSILSVGNELYPNLFADIYCGKNQYNQNLTNKALIFEMGTYLIEKELVLNSVPMLANVIKTALYGTTIDENGNLEIGGTTGPTIDEHFDNKNNSFWWIWLLVIPVLIAAIFAAFYYSIKKNKKALNYNKNSKIQ